MEQPHAAPPVVATEEDLGPGDAPYVSGFAPEYEIYDRLATHWTRYNAGVALPLSATVPVSVSYRFARVYGETAQVDVRDADGREFARGIVSCDARELELLRGAKTADMERRLGYRVTDEVIHRDNLVIL